MGIIKKQAFQSSALLYTGTIIGFLTTGLLAPNLLSKSEIGTLKLIQSYATIFMSLGILGFTTITIRFIPKFYNAARKHHNGFFGILLLVGIAGCLVVFIISEAIKPAIIENNLEKSRQFAEYYFLIIPLTFFLIFYALFDSYNNALYRSSFGVLIRDFVQRIIILIGLLLVFIRYFDFEQYLYYYVIAFCLPTLIMFIHLYKHKAVDLKINFSFLDKRLVTSMASVGLFGLLNSFSNIAVLQIDSIMVNMYMDSAAVGIYTITFYFGTLVLVPSRALNKIAPTIIAKAFKEEDLDTVKDIYNKSSASLFLIGALILLGLVVNLDNVFNIIPQTYADGKYVILVIGLANLLKMAGGSNDSIITYSQHYKMTTVFLTTLVSLIILFNFIFIPLWGMTGAAIASLLAVLIYNLVKFIFIKIKFGFNPYNLQYLVIIIISSVIYVLVGVLPDLDNFILEILIDSLLTTLLFYVAIKSLPIAIEINSSVHQVLRRILDIIKPKIK